MNWDPKTRPPPDVCPKHFCFHWAEAGARIDASGGEYDTFDEAIAAATTLVTTARCASIFGTCSRAEPGAGHEDLYEPNEAALRHAGLPWFFFVSGVESLAEEFHAEFLSQAEQLWGTPPGTHRDT